MSLTPPPPLTYANRFQKRGKAQTQTQVCLAFPNQEIITAFFIVVVIMIQKGLHVNIDLHERNVGPAKETSLPLWRPERTGHLGGSA